MAATAATLTTFFPLKPHQRKPFPSQPLLLPSTPPHQSLIFTSKPSSSSPSFPLSFTHPSNAPSCFSSQSSPNPISSNGYLDIDNLINTHDPQRPLRFVLWVLVWTSVSLVFSAVLGDKAARAAVSAASDSIRASSFGLKVASALRSFGWADEAVVFALATLPVVELRGAIPVGYWLQLNPLFLTVLAVLGNMVPVPFIVLYLKRLAKFLTRSSPSASRLLEILFEKARKKAGPVEEFQWLGLMLFVAVPFPGTGAWTGAIIASILDMPFWSALSANFCGVVLAGLLVNLLVNLGLKYAIVAGFILFFISTFMWTALRNLKKFLNSSK